MKRIFEVIKNNMSNIFSIIGILLTIYFSVYYVPQYSKEIQVKKIESVNNSLIETVQELIYNNKQVTSSDLETLIKGKELSYNIVYPYSVDEMLIQVQDRFISNKFITLSQRKELFTKISELRSSLPKKAESVPKKKSPYSFITYSSYLISFLGLILSLMGMISVWIRNKEFKEKELQDNLEEREEAIKTEVKSGITFETEVFEALKPIVGEDNIKYAGRVSPIDFIVRRSDNSRIGIEVKYTETGVIPVKVAEQLKIAALKISMPILLISNAPLTKNASRIIEEFNARNANTKIYIIVVSDSASISDSFRSFLSSLA